MENVRALHGCSILVVDSEPILALELESAFEEVGADVIHASLCESALPLTDQSEICAAVVEYMLRDGACLRLIERLADREIPTIIYTAHSPLPDAICNLPVADKLTDPREIVTKVRGLFANGPKKQKVDRAGSGDGNAEGNAKVH